MAKNMKKIIGELKNLLSGIEEIAKLES